MIRFFKDIFGFNIEYQEKVFKHKNTTFGKAFLWAFIPLFILLTGLFFYKADSNIKKITANSRNDVFIDFFIDNKCISITVLNENFTLIFNNSKNPT